MSENVSPPKENELPTKKTRGFPKKNAQPYQIQPKIQRFTP
jgi:hypothetical protein